ncbi:MAG: bifunctional nicotinamidase/pyrazinamidase [Leeuwenhoekiella sp.]
MKALIIIDLQNDFIPGGSLAVPNGDEIVDVINKLQHKFDLVIATQDWHPENHSSFAKNHDGAKEFEIIDLNGLNQVLWPVHCVQSTHGAKFHPDLEVTKIETIFRKGTNPALDSYSGFFDNAHLKSTGLQGYLKDKGVTEVYFCGLAAEFCVFYSIKDAVESGFSAYLIEDATRALDTTEFLRAKSIILEMRGRIIDSSEILNADFQ